MSNKTKYLLGLVVAFIGARAGAEQAFVAGPVEALSKNGASVTVLGQTFVVLSAQDLIPTLARAGARPERLILGEYVVVTGLRLPNGQLVAKKFGRLETSYVAGASNVFLSGVVTSVNSGLGVIRVGNVDVYTNDALVSSAISVQTGSKVEVLGRQSQPLGVVWAAEISTGEIPERDSANVSAIVQTGRGIQSIQGTGIQSIQGTGIQSIQGTGALSIQGTGKQSIQGTGKQSIQGTGVQSIQGTGALSIQGTGRQSIQGTGKQSIQGTGAR